MPTWRVWGMSEVFRPLSRGPSPISRERHVLPMFGTLGGVAALCVVVTLCVVALISGLTAFLHKDAKRRTAAFQVFSRVLDVFGRR